ncbi:MAG: S-adenosylmethionine decarboxylase [Clostridia bacterium]|nr:S-adenosylmethionine decarboxylase [Clostridia bacterium]
MIASYHYMLDAYGCVVEQANSMLGVNDLLVQLTNELQMKPVMPPFLIPYYYSQDSEDVGISAFCICANGGHITIHTFPYRSCYFVDILTDQFFTEAEVTNLISNQIYASTITTNVIDRRDFDSTEANIDLGNDFGPHYMISIKDIDINFEDIYTWLDHIAPRIEMQAIARPYVIFDRVNDPKYISGVLVVAQSHIAFHYSIEEREAHLDIFSCSFLENGTVEDIIHTSFGGREEIHLFARGSKHRIQCHNRSRQSRIEREEAWQNHILSKSSM